MNRYATETPEEAWKRWVGEMPPHEVLSYSGSLEVALEDILEGIPTVHPEEMPISEEEMRTVTECLLAHLLRYDREAALQVVRELDEAIVKGSEEAVLTRAVQDLTQCSPEELPEALDWWKEAYRYLDWAMRRNKGEQALAALLEDGLNPVGWTPPTPSGEALRNWREGEQLTLQAAAEIAGVELRSWQRWESGERAVPQWLPDVLFMRQGSCP